MPGKTGSANADGQLVTGSGVIYGMVLDAGTAAASVILYDNTAASGTVLWRLSSIANNAVSVGGLSIAFSKGIYVDITGTGAPVVTVNWS